MKRFARTMAGVTLLEIMLVLAIAAMIVVMSIRYYQSASSNQQANTALSQVQAVMAAMDNLGMAAGYESANQDKLAAIVGSANMVTPTGGDISLDSKTKTTYQISVPLNTTICPSVAAKLEGNEKLTVQPCADGTLTFSYDSTK